MRQGTFNVHSCNVRYRARIRHVYFPKDAHVSLLVLVADRRALEVGREGMVGFGRCPPLQHELYRYAYAKLVQARQTAACNRFHPVEARLARWLLMTRDRMRADHFHLTHEFLADTLGIRRVGVTNAAGALQRRKLIGYRHGNIRILDWKGLKAAACGCYEIVRNLAS